MSLRTVGAGHAAAFTYDLARSIVLHPAGEPELGRPEPRHAHLRPEPGLARALQRPLLRRRPPRSPARLDRPQPRGRPAGRRAAATARQHDHPVQHHAHAALLVPAERREGRRRADGRRSRRRRHQRPSSTRSTALGPAQCSGPRPSARPCSTPGRARAGRRTSSRTPLPGRSRIQEATNWNSLRASRSPTTRGSTAIPRARTSRRSGMLNQTLTHELAIFAQKYAGPPGAADDAHPLHRVERLGQPAQGRPGPRDPAEHRLLLLPVRVDAEPAGHVHGLGPADALRRLQRLADRRLPGDDLRRRRRHDGPRAPRTTPTRWCRRRPRR